MNDLEMYREQLALCDDKIIDALVERNSIIEKIMAYKEEYGMPILQPHQEEKQKRRLEEKLKENKYKEEIFDVFGCILRNSKRIQARKLFDYNIVLIGFMGAGKSTISDYLSTMFDMDIVEMDQVIAEREEMSIPDIFATYGEEYFRDLETNQLKGTEKRDKYKVYGELINTYGYNLEPGAKVLEALNYYNNEIVKIPLDTTKTPLENAQRYFEKYNKQKRTFEALSELTEETKEDITYL